LVPLDVLREKMMLWNIYFLEQRPGRMVARYIGQVESPNSRTAEKKAASLCWDVSGATSDSYVARDPNNDGWHRPI